MRITRKQHIKHRRMTVGDIGIAYLEKEALPAVDNPLTIVFIHGFPFNKNSWRAQLDALPDHVRGIAIDVRGHGTSTMGHGFFSLDLFAGDLIEFLRKMEIDQTVVCGASMGGYIALRAHELAPQKFRSLVLCGTNSLADDNEAKSKRFETIRSVLQHGTRAFSITFAERVFSKHSQEHRTDAVELIRSSIRRNNIRGICATLLALASRRDTTDHLKHIAIPTLLLWGAEDAVTPKQQAELLNAELPNAQYVEFPNCGHLPNLEDPVKFNQVLLGFLEKQGRETK